MQPPFLVSLFHYQNFFIKYILVYIACCNISVTPNHLPGGSEIHFG
eukprot:UN07843